MATEILNTTAFPYSAVVSIRSTFADGRVSLGTGALVGKNDVLTATHVVYQPDNGGYASSVQVFPGADFNGMRSVLESAPYESFYSGSVVAFPIDVFIDANNASTSWTEAASDVAVIGLTQAVGFTTGWFGLATGHNDSEWASELGYPREGTGMMTGLTLARSNNGKWISGYSYDGSTLLGAGASGGPLYVNDNYLPAIIGVKSSGNSYVNYWADIDYKYNAITAAIAANDNLIGGSSVVTGTNAHDRLVGDKTNRVIDGLGGMDVIVYASPSTQAKIFTTGNHETNVTGLANSNFGDTLTNVERIQFTDTNIALDISPSQNAGSIYMLYKAAFDRAPDISGMGYWLAKIDGGKNIVTDIAAGFVNTPEFIAKYEVNPSNAAYVNSLYQNVLGRAGDAGGLAYWNKELDAGNISKAAVLVQFATLAEGAANIAPLIAKGIPYTEWAG